MHLVDAVVQGDIHIAGRVTDVWLDGTTVEGSLFCRGATIGAIEPPRADSARADWAPHDWLALGGPHVKVRDDVYLSAGFKATGLVNLARSSIGGKLDVSEGIFTGGVDLRDANVGILEDRDARWPQSRGLNLAGFSYQSLGSDSVADPPSRLEWVRRQSGFALQPYTQLAAVLRRAGDNDGAAEVLMAMEKDRRTALARRSQLSGWTKLRSLFLGAIVGHGYRPGRAVIALLALWAITVLILAVGAGSNALIPARVDAGQGQPESSECLATDYPCFNPFAYAAEVVIPLVSLDQREYWQPEGDYSLYRMWTWVATLLGWILTTLAVVALTGLIRKE